MQFTLTDYPVDWAALRGTPQPRADGLHLGEVIARISAYWNKGRDMERGEPTDAARAHWEKGFLWEDIFTSAWEIRHGRSRANLIPQLEMIRDGIIITPDLVDPTRDVPRGVLIETKATCRSVRKAEQPELHFREWLIQVQGYAYVLGIREVELVAMFLCGDWRQNNEPTPKLMAFTFTDQELAENWAMVLRIAAIMRKERS